MININEFSLDNLNNDSKNLITVSESCGNNVAVAKLSESLKEAIDSKFDADKPLIITLVGGTGSGKSRLFCKLIDIDGISPSSDTERNFTDRCLVYAPKQYIGNLLPEDLGEVRYIESDKKGVVLVDTPDLDGTKEENILLARAMAEISDVLIFVTDYEKYSNAKLHESLKRWVYSKRWYFVLNKADKLELGSEIKEVKKHFIDRIKGLGFARPDKNIFVVSSKNTSEFDFTKLKNEIISDKSSISNKLFHYWTKINKYKNAVNRRIEVNGESLPLKKYLENLKNDLKEKERSILAKNDVEIRNIIEEPECKLSIKKALTYELYNSMCDKAINFTSLYLWASKFFQHTREKETKLELEASLNRSEALKANYRASMNFLHEKNLISWEYYKDAVLKSDFKLSDLCIKKKAEEISSSVSTKLRLFMANLLPVCITLGVMGLAVYKLVRAEFLPSDYYTQAVIVLVIISWVGAAMLGNYLNRQDVSGMSKELAQNIVDNQDGFSILSEKLVQLEEIIRLTDSINTNANRQLKLIEPEITSGYGIGAKD